MHHSHPSMESHSYALKEYLIRSVIVNFARHEFALELLQEILVGYEREVVRNDADSTPPPDAAYRLSSWRFQFKTDALIRQVKKDLEDLLPRRLLHCHPIALKLDAVCHP